MIPSPLRARIVAERADWIRRMLAEIRALPLGSYPAFQSDRRNHAAAESYLRRALEALLDLGRHVLAKGFGEAVTEYREIAPALVRLGVLTDAEGNLLRQLAGYRNRMVHFYHEISERELYDIGVRQLGDVETVLAGILRWIREHPERIDRGL